jgi:hypothetical protein
VVDGLTTLLTRARDAGLIGGLVPNVIEGGGGLTHLHYADGTIIFLEAGEEVIANTKFLSHCFENMTGFRINYHKSEVIVMGASREESTGIANMLNCKVGSLTIKYLGVPVSNTNIFKADLHYVGLKVEKGFLFGGG